MPKPAFRDVFNFFLAAVGGWAGLSQIAPPLDLVGFALICTVALGALGFLTGLAVAHRWGLRQGLWHSPGELLVFSSLYVVAYVLFVLSYVSLWQSYTASYQDRRVVIGTELTPQGKKFYDENQGCTKEEAVAAAIGKAEQVWTARSIREQETWLWTVFCLFTFFTVHLFVVVAYLVEGTVRPIP